MASVTIRNMPDEVHRALRVRAARHGRSTEAEIRDILELAVRSPDRVKIGSLLAAIAQEAGVTGEDGDPFDQVRDNTLSEPVDLG